MLCFADAMLQRVWICITLSCAVVLLTADAVLCCDMLTVLCVVVPCPYCAVVLEIAALHQRAASCSQHCSHTLYFCQVLHCDKAVS